MNVRVVKAGQHESLVSVNDTSACSGKSLDLGFASDGDDTVSVDGDGFGDGSLPVHRAHAGVDDDEIGDYRPSVCGHGEKSSKQRQRKDGTGECFTFHISVREVGEDE